MHNWLEILDGLLHHKAEKHFFEMVDAPMLSFGVELLGIPVRRDDLVSVVYSTELNSTTSLVPPQRTDRYGILDEKPPTFQRLSG